MGIGDWLGLRKDPVLERLIQTYGLKSVGRTQAEGRAHRRSLQVSANKDGSGRAAVRVVIGDGVMDPCFGFYRPDDEDLNEALEFGPGWFESFQQGTHVRIGRFLLEFEGEPYWKPLLDRHAAAMADYLGRYSPALRWVSVNFPGVEFELREPASGGWKHSPDMNAIERDVATSSRLLEFVCDAAAAEGIPPSAGAD